MGKIILVLTFFVWAQLSFAQTFEPNSNLNDIKIDDSIISRSGSFTIENLPIELNLVSGYKYINANSTKSILVNYWGNPASSVEDVVGMIIPDETDRVEDINKAWILSLMNVGHIQDYQAGNMGFSWILEGLNSSQDNQKTEVKWAWPPKYDLQHHRLSLPLMYITDGDTVLNYRQYVFGNTDMIIIEPVVLLSDIQWLSEIYGTVTEGINFTAGSRYEDFNENSQQYAYKSVSAFLKGIPATASSSSQGYSNEESDNPSFSDKVIGWIGKVSLILLSVMILLMIAVAFTNIRKESSKSVLRLGINVLLRIAVFGVVYVLLLMLAIFLIWLGVWLTIAILSNYISSAILIYIVGGWIIIGSFLYAIIRSLFIFKHSEQVNRLEISQTDAPKLFALIRDVAGAVGEQMPKHTYVSSEVNACVFYDKPIISLFFPGRKNLEIGLGLFFGLNKQELKAVIAHEYGHFGQKSIRVGQVVSICYNIISNLVNADGALYVRPILKKTFFYVQRGYMTLSRAMEYEADEKSASVAGNKATISALCKIEVISGRFNVYNNLLTGIYDSKHGFPSSYWLGYEQFESFSDEFDGIKYDSSSFVCAPLLKTPPSRVKLKDVWISHPLLAQRIENICLNENSALTIQAESTRELVGPEIYKQTSEELMRNAGFIDGSVFSEQHFKELLAEELAERSFPLRMRPFLSRDLCGFKITENEVSDLDLNAESVFSETNAQTVESFAQAISDYQTMMMFKNKQTSEKEIQYDGRVYTRKSVPVEKQLEIIKTLEPRVVSIDKSVFYLAMSVASDKDLIFRAYNNIFYSQAVIRHIADNVIPTRDSVAKQIGRGGNQDEQTFRRIQKILLNFKANMKEMIDNLEMSRLNPVIHVDSAKSIKRVEDEWLLSGTSIGGDEIEYIFSLPDQIISLFQSLAYYSKKIVSDTIEGKTPLMYWNNSVTAQNTQG